MDFFYERFFNKFHIYAIIGFLYFLFFILPIPNPASLDSFENLLEIKPLFAAGIVISTAIAVGYFEISQTMHLIWIAANGRENNYASKLASAIIGSIERLFYVLLFIISPYQNVQNSVLAFQAIGFWLLLKVAGQWRDSPEENHSSELDRKTQHKKISQNRTSYQIFLIGNALSIGYAIISYAIFYFLLNYSSINAAWAAIIVFCAMILANRLINCSIKFLGKNYWYNESNKFKAEGKILEARIAYDNAIKLDSKFMQTSNSEGNSLDSHGYKIE